MNLFHKLQDIYFDALRLSEELESIPLHCECHDSEEHLKGRCCCSLRQTEAVECKDKRPSSCADPQACVQRLAEGIRLFRDDWRRHRPNCGEKSVELLRWLSLVGDAVRRLSTSLEHVEAEMKEFHAECALQPLLRLKAENRSFRKYVGELYDALSDVEKSGRGYDPVPSGEGSHQDTSVAAAPEVHRAEEGSGPGQENAPPTKEELRELIRRHRVCYEVWPEWSVPAGVRTQVGYELRICGVNEHGGEQEGSHPVPGCRHCRRTFEDLRRIALWILPRGERASRYEVGHFDHALHLAQRGRSLRKEVVAGIKVLHRHEVNAPLDECEQRCLKEMRGRLKDLGVLEGRYPEEQIKA